MELGSLFTEQKWNILSMLSEGKFSPMQIAEKSNTTMANISQQLRLLEAVDLVKKEKIRNRDKGKPRTLFQLSNNYGYVVSAMNGFAERKLVVLDELNKILLKTWFLDPEFKYYVEKFIWGIENHLKDIKLIVLIENTDSVDVIIGSSDLKLKIKDIAIKKTRIW